MRLTGVLFLAVATVAAHEPSAKLPNVLWLLIDDISAERFPESGNQALAGMLPGIEELKADGAVWYDNFHSPASTCSPSQVGLFSSMEAGDIIGGQYPFMEDAFVGQESYRPPHGQKFPFLPERLRKMGYRDSFVSSGGGASFVDVNAMMDQIWDPTLADVSETDEGPWFGILDLMDVHQLISGGTKDAPIPIRNPDTKLPYQELPFGEYGYTKPGSLLFNTGPNGSPQAETPLFQDLESVDIVGYEGDFDESTLSHQNGGVPGYLPDEMGVRSILAREYDLIRNMDFRVSRVIERLKERNEYDNTIIFLFGDHGSGTHKEKLMLQPQTLKPPLYVKFPKDFPLSDSVFRDGSGHFRDDRLTSILDIGPTVLSILGRKTPRHMSGRPFAGEFESKKERTILFAVEISNGPEGPTKSFAAFNKDFFYQRHLTTTVFDNHRQGLLSEEQMEALSGQELEAVLRLSERQGGESSLSSISLLNERLRLLMYRNALDKSYPSKYYSLAADQQRPPAEQLFDLQRDPFATQNLIVEQVVEVKTCKSLQRCGTNVTEVKITFGGDIFERLDPSQSDALERLQRQLEEWMERQGLV